MPGDMIVVTFDAKRRLVRTVMSGMLTVAEVERFARDEQAAVRAMGLGSGEFDLLVEALGNQVQTQVVMEAFTRLVHHAPMKARRIATVRDGVLTRMQSRRIARERSMAEIFETLADAERWLAS